MVVVLLPAVDGCWVFAADGYWPLAVAGLASADHGCWLLAVDCCWLLLRCYLQLTAAGCWLLMAVCRWRVAGLISAAGGNWLFAADGCWPLALVGLPSAVAADCWRLFAAAGLMSAVDGSRAGCRWVGGN